MDKKRYTYIIPLNAMPWWRFFFEIWHLGIAIVKILVAFSFLNLAFRDLNCQNFWWLVFSNNPLQKLQKITFLTKFGGVSFFEIWHLGIATVKILVAFFF